MGNYAAAAALQNGRLMQIICSPIVLFRFTFVVPILLGKNSNSVAWMVCWLMSSLQLLTLIPQQFLWCYVGIAIFKHFRNQYSSKVIKSLRKLYRESSKVDKKPEVSGALQFFRWQIYQASVITIHVHQNEKNRIKSELVDIYLIQHALFTRFFTLLHNRAVAWTNTIIYCKDIFSWYDMVACTYHYISDAAGGVYSGERVNGLKHGTGKFGWVIGTFEARVWQHLVRRGGVSRQ